VVLFLPGNIEKGLHRGGLRRRTAERIVREVARGVPPAELAKRRFTMLSRKRDEKVERIEMLLESGVNSFGKEYQKQLDRCARGLAATAKPKKRR